MNLLEFKTNERLTVSNLRCLLLMEKPLRGDSARVQSVGDNRYKLIMGFDVYDFSITDEQDSRLFSEKLRRFPYNLAYIKSSETNDGMFFLHVVFFYSASVETRMNIILSPKVKEALDEKHLIPKNKKPEDCVKENFELSDGTRSCFAYTCGKYRREIEDGEEAESDVSGDMDEDDEGLRDLRLFGRDYSLYVRVKEEGNNQYLCAESVRFSDRDVPPMALKLGDLSFEDGNAIVSERMKKELENKTVYLEIWDRYSGIEGDFLLRKARKIGIIQIDRGRINIGEGGLIVYPRGLTKEQERYISAGDYLQVSDKLPVFMEDTETSWKDLKSYLEAQWENKRTIGTIALIKIIRIDKSGYWVVDLGNNREFPDGIITYGIFGDMRQILRRETARNLIRNGEAAFPALGHIIEGVKSEVIQKSQRNKKIKPISNLVKEKVFTYEPRSVQRDAIDIALNTPDIALIQGPPGTGKTTVITAIIERLNELADKRKDVRGQVLVTSFQHDAVRNVIERLSVNSLPTIKYGRQGEDDLFQEKALGEWCCEYANKLRERNPSVQVTSVQKELERRHTRYLMSPNDTNARLLLEFAKDVVFDNQIIEEIELIISEINEKENTDSSGLIDKIRRIRTTREGFMDDGCETADDLLATLEDIMKPGAGDNDLVFEVLEEAADYCGEDVDDSLLKRLDHVKKTLLKKCAPNPTYRIERPREDILMICSKVNRALKVPKNTEDEILYNLLNEIEGNASQVEETIAGYNFVFAATTQQSEGTDIRRAKGVEKADHPIYDTVIIDEAARVNPGDLMIPMSQAQRRIILVGDHRQLPHIYDEEIFESMREEGEEIDEDIIENSMFQYLRERAEELYKADGIKRTITLDAQFRMHPELGEFISRNFYAPYGEGFESPLPEKFFEQRISPKPYLWVDIPFSSGREEKRGTSRIRKCEADYICSKIRDIILSEEGKELSFGVITFYSAQAKLIREMINGRDISSRVRVGSVDSFQGMEFDVIFLSTVRSRAAEPEYDDDQLESDSSKLGLKYYGFLTSENRLCVALSRQKRLLITVGDAALFHKGRWGMLAQKCVPAMKNLYELCEREGVVVNA